MQKGDICICEVVIMFVLLYLFSFVIGFNDRLYIF